MNPVTRVRISDVAFFCFFYRKKFNLKKKNKCLEWGLNPRLHRRTELKSAALDHSAIEACAVCDGKENIKTKL